MKETFTVYRDGTKVVMFDENGAQLKTVDAYATLRGMQVFIEQTTPNLQAEIIAVLMKRFGNGD